MFWWPLRANFVVARKEKLLNNIPIIALIETLRINWYLILNVIEDRQNKKHKSKCHESLRECITGKFIYLLLFFSEFFGIGPLWCKLVGIINLYICTLTISAIRNPLQRKIFTFFKNIHITFKSLNQMQKFEKFFPPPIISLSKISKEKFMKVLYLYRKQNSEKVYLSYFLRIWGTYLINFLFLVGVGRD